MCINTRVSSTLSRINSMMKLGLFQPDILNFSFVVLFCKDIRVQCNDPFLKL